MSQIVDVKLHSPDSDSDILSFVFSDESTLSVNLTDENCQNQLKSVFLKLFELQVEDAVTLNLIIEEGYKRVLFKEVCEEYIKDLNHELADVRKTIQETMPC